MPLYGSELTSNYLNKPYHNVVYTGRVFIFSAGRTVMRNRTFPQTIGLFLITIIIGITAVGARQDSLTWYNPVSPEVINNRVMLDTAPARLDAAGGPDLPMMVWIREYPKGTVVQGLNITRLDTAHKLLTAPLPVLPPKPTVSGSTPAGSVTNPLTGPDFYPNCWYTLETRSGLSPDTLEPVIFAVVRLYPVRVHGTQMQYLKAFEADLDVSHTADFQGTGYKISNKIPNKNSTASGRGDAALLVLAPQEFLDAMGDYITHKTNAGISVLARSVDEILATGTGRDDAEKIKIAIHAACEINPVGFVLLAGDADRIPVRYTFHAEYAGSADWQNIPADLYYADLYNSDGEFCDWDANANDVFGEYISGNADGCDFAPDVLIGRIPASTVAELTGALDKIIHYETTVTGTETWQNRVVLAAADTFTADGHGDTTGVPEGEATKELIAGESLAGYDLVKLYETERYNRTAELTTQALHNAILDGAQYVNFANHGWVQGWAFDGGYTVDDVDSLDNYDHLPITFGYACSTGVFDTENAECPSYGVPKCLAEAFVLNPNGGAVGYYGATRTAFAGGYGLGGHLGAFGLLDREFFHGVGNGHTVQGRLWLGALMELLLGKGLTDTADYISILEFHFFGDPTLAAGGAPELPDFHASMFAPDETTGGDQDGCLEPLETIELDLNLMNDGAPAHNVTVTLETESEYLNIVNGSTSLPDFERGAQHPVEPPLSFDISATCPMGTLEEVTLTIASDERTEQISRWLFIGEAPYLTADQLWITTDTNNDNIAGPGESVKFAPRFINIGCQTASGVASAITIDDPWVTDYGIRGDGVLPDLDPFISVIPQKLFYMELDPMTPDGHEVTCDMTFTGTGGDATWDFSLPMTIHDNLMPAVSKFKVNPAVPEPGQEITVTVMLEDPAGVTSAAITVHGFEMDQPVTATLYDDGQHNDGAAGDNMYGAQIVVPDIECYMAADITAEDTLGNAGTVSGAGGIVTVPFITDDPILVIGGADDDINMGLYTQALDDAGYGYDVWSYYRGLPPNDILDRYADGAIILYYSFTYPYLDKDGRDAVDYYLAQGGSLLITEQDIGWVMIEAGSTDMADWYHNTLLAEYIEDNSGIHTVDGVADFGDLSFDITGGSGANNQDYPSLIEPIAPAETCFVYSDYSGPHSGTAGIRAERNGGKHVYLAYGFEGIASQQDRADAMDAMMTWFGIEKTPRMCPFNQSPGFWIGPELSAGVIYGSSAFCESDMRIYMAGGLTPEGQPADPSVYALDTVSHQSTDTGADLQAPRFYHATACLDDHGREKIYFIGGLNATGGICSDIEVYDPVENTVSVLSSDPLPVEVDGIPGSYVTDGNIFYLIGLARLNAPFQTGDTWMFNPMADAGQRWSTLASTLDNPRFFAATAAMNGKIYLMGGISQVTETEAYGHTTVSVLDTSAEPPVWDDTVVSPMPSAMFFNAGAAIPDGANVAAAGSILVCAGIDTSGGNSAYWYDPIADTWTATRPVQNTRMLTGNIHRVPMARGASIWVCGGHHQWVYSDTEILYLGDDPTDCWMGIRTYPETVVPGCCLRVGLDLAGDNAMTPIDCYLAMEVAGAWFFITADPAFPTFTADPLPFFTNAPIPEDLTYCGPLFEIPFPADMPALNGTFYAASLVSGTAEFAGGFAWADFIVP